MTRLITVFTLVLVFGMDVTAGPTEGLSREFTKVEEHYKNRGISDEFKTKTLERNIFSAIRLSLQRRFLNFEEMSKDINSTNVSYEFKEQTFICYLQFKEYMIYYEYAMDPRIYMQSPVAEKFLIKPDKMPEEHQKEEKK